MSVDAICANAYAFAARKTDGTVVTWGDSNRGGDSSGVASDLTGVEVIYCHARGRNFAAKKFEGTVASWGEFDYRLADAVDVVYANRHAFAAKKPHGTVVTWGYPNEGGPILEPTGGD